MTTYVDAGHCSSCGVLAKRDGEGRWWHVGPSCLPPHVMSQEVLFVPTTSEPKPGEGDSTAKRKARDIADRQQRTVPADRSMTGSDGQR